MAVFLGGLYLILLTAYGVVLWQLYAELSVRPGDPNLLYPESIMPGRLRSLAVSRRQALRDRGDEPRIRQLQRRIWILRRMLLISVVALFAAESAR